MNTELLQQIGLTKSQAKAYIALIKFGDLSAPELAIKVGETRTNAYMVLDKLVDLGLVSKKERAKKLIYEPTNPTNLERLIEDKRKDILATEKQVRDSMPQLLNYFYTYQHQPGVRFFQGKEGIVKMYEDQRRTAQDIYFIRSDADFNVLGKDLYKHMQQRAKLKIRAHGIEPAEDDNMRYGKEHDREMLRDMAWAPREAFTAPVNLYVYGNKTALISYGEEVIGTIIESPQIAEAMKQIFALVKVGVESMNAGGVKARK
jgi:sugar-specific transcriptional regulator TrmB